MSGDISEASSSRPSNRNDIQSNLLADRLERFIVRSKPFLPWIAAAIVIIVAVLIILGMINSRDRQYEAAAWKEVFFANSDPAILENIASDFPGSAASLWALQESSDASLNRALLQIYTDQSVAKKLIADAQESYRNILSESRDPLLTNRANLGLAKCYDSLGDIELAVQHYGKVISAKDTAPNLAEQLTDRVQFLQSEEGKEFYAWFNATQIQPQATDKPAEDLKSLPEEADIEFDTPAALPTEPIVPPSDSKVTPTEATATPSEATVTPSEATVTPSEATVTPSEATVTPSEATVTPSGDAAE